MLYRRFGRTNLQMPVLSTGGMRYQYKWQDVPLDQVPPDSQANLEACIRRSIDLGINHIETARGYGSSERQLGLILPKFPRDKLIIQTKIGPEEDTAKFAANFHESLERLQLQYVDLLSIHGVNNQQTLDWSIRPGGCLHAARRLQEQGLARHIGFSTHAPTDQILKAIDCPDDNGFDYVNLHWYYIFQRNWPAVLRAARRDMGVFIISPTDKGGQLFNPPAKLLELCKPLHPIVFNDLFCLARPEIHTLSVGAARPSDFDLHVEAVNLAARAAELVAPIASRLNAAYHAAHPRIADPFGLPLPDHDAAPGNLNIPVILWLLKLANAFDMRTYAQMRYNLFGNGGHWFPGQPAINLDTLDLKQIEQSSGLGSQLKPLLAEAHALLAKEQVKRLSQS